MLHEILANNTWYKVTNTNTFDSWGQKCFQADAMLCNVSSNTGASKEWFDCKVPTFIPVSTIQKIEIHNNK